MDAKDILGIRKTLLPITLKRKSRTQKEPQRKPDGISHEVYALTGGLAPLMPSIDVAQLKKRPSDEKKNLFHAFRLLGSVFLYQTLHGKITCSSTIGSELLMVFHQQSVDVVKYTDEEYHKYLTDPMWTKEETDQLFDLCERFDLHFIILADRFPSSRTMEELKDRYYRVSRAVLMARAPYPGDVSSHPLVKDPYNVSQEVERKCALSMVFFQTKHQESKDAEVLAEAKRIMEARMASWVAEEPELPVAPHVGSKCTDRTVVLGDTVSPPSNVQLPSGAIVPLTLITADSASTLASWHMLRVYLWTYAPEQMVQAASSSAGLQTIKRVELMLQDLGNMPFASILVRCGHTQPLLY